MRNIRALLYIQFTELNVVSSFKAGSAGKRSAIILALTLPLILTTPLIIILSLFPTLIFADIELPLKGPGLTIAMTSIVLFISTTVRAHTIFSKKDWRLLAPMPIPTWQIIYSKLLFLYILLFTINATLMLPHILFLQTLFPYTFIALSLIPLIFITPLIPFVLGTALTIGVTAITRRFQHIDSRHVYGVIALIASLCITFFTSTLRSDTSLVPGSYEAALYLAHLVERILKIYVPAWLLLPEYIPSLYLAEFLFIVLSIGTFTTFVYFISKHYVRLNAYLTTKKVAVKKRQKNKHYSQLAALLRKEFKLLGQFPTLLMNYTISYVLFFILCGGLFMTDLHTIITFLAPTLEFDASSFNSPFIYATMMAMTIQGFTAYASSAFSVEGKNVWLMQTLPLPFSAILQAKLIATLILTLPTIPIFLTIIFLKQQLGFVNIVLLATWLASYAIFAAITNLFINFMLPKYNWKSETEVIKQGMAAIVSSFGHVALLIVFAIIVNFELLLPAPSFFILQIVIFICTSLGLFFWLCRQNLFITSKT
jgi:ABC-2 type transport system permease protein